MFFRRRLFRASRSKDGGRADFSARREENLAKAPILLRDAKRTRRRRRFYYATRRELGEGADFSARREENLAKAPILLRDAKRIGEGADFTARCEENSTKAPILLRDAKRNRRRREVHCATRREIGDAYDFFLHCDHLSKKFFIRFLFSSDLHTMGPIKGPKRKENP